MTFEFYSMRNESTISEARFSNSTSSLVSASLTAVIARPEMVCAEWNVALTGNIASASSKSHSNSRIPLSPEEMLAIRHTSVELGASKKDSPSTERISGAVCTPLRHDGDGDGDSNEAGMKMAMAMLMLIAYGQRMLMATFSNVISVSAVYSTLTTSFPFSGEGQKFTASQQTTNTI